MFKTTTNYSNYTNYYVHLTSQKQVYLEMYEVKCRAQQIREIREIRGRKKNLRT